MKLRPWMVAVATAVVIFGGIAATSAFNLWHTESTKEPAKYASGEFAGQSNPGDIRGSYTFGDIATAFGVPAADLAKAFVLSEAETANAAAFPVKSLEGRVEGVGTDSVRWFVALVKGLPYTPEEGTLLPGPAIGLLRQRGTLTEAALATVEASRAQADASQAETTTKEASAATEESADRSIKGKTTFQEILDWGVSKEALEKALGVAMGAPAVAVRDYCTQKGIEFSTVRTELQKLVDAAK
jgi:hypothetical protein